MVNQLLIFLFPFLMALAACTEATTEREVQQAGALTFDEEESDSASMATATFAGGCFWCTEAVFERLQGVKRVVSGYAGGEEQNPIYQDVSAGRTGHAESVQVHYDTNEISYLDLLEVFFATHDPTTLNRQGPDIGKQYRSAVFFHNQEQQRQTQQYIRELNEAGVYQNKIVTQVEPLERFWEAEEYHQDYYNRNPKDPYVLQVAKPKVTKFEAAFRNRLKSY